MLWYPVKTEIKAFFRSPDHIRDNINPHAFPICAAPLPPITGKNLKGDRKVRVQAEIRGYNRLEPPQPVNILVRLSPRRNELIIVIIEVCDIVLWIAALLPITEPQHFVTYGL